MRYVKDKSIMQLVVKVSHKKTIKVDYVWSITYTYYIIYFVTNMRDI